MPNWNELLLRVTQAKLGRMIDTGEATSNPQKWNTLYRGWESMKQAKAEYVKEQLARFRKERANGD